MVADPIPFPVPNAPPEKPFRRHGMGYVWDVAEHAVMLGVDRLAQRSHELSGEVEVRVRGKHLHLARVNLSSTTARKTLAKALTERTPSVPWETLVEQFCVSVIKKERQGSEMQYAAPSVLAETRYVVEKLAIQDKACMIYGPGGGAKGYLAVATCVGVLANRGIGPLSTLHAEPLYLDWEDDYATFCDRVTRVSHGMGIDVPRVPYRRMRGALPDQVADLARLIDDHGVTYAVVDSFSAASGQGDGVNMKWDDIAHRFFDALDLIPNVTWLIIGHVSADGARGGQQVAGKAFGSIQIMNRLRVAWEMRSERDPTQPVVRSVLYHTKYNHTELFPPIGLTLTFDGNAAVFEDGRAVPATRTLADRIEADLYESGERSTRALSLALSTNEATIRATLNREKGRFRHLDNGNWALATTNYEDLPF